MNKKNNRQLGYKKIKSLQFHIHIKDFPQNKLPFQEKL